VKQNQRTTGKEQYYTPSETAERLVRTMLSFASAQSQWLEPAGGTGVFVNAMKRAGIESVVSYDIEPLHPSVLQTADFLLEDIEHLKGCITLTNPPFGRANKLSVPFFNKCATVSDKIGFLVPKSWRKWSVINRLHPSFHLAHDEELSVNFDYPNDTNRSTGKLATVFQVWEKKPYVREKITVKDRKYIAKVNPSCADVSLTIFGRGCGRVRTDFPPLANTTQMFLKTAEPWVLDALRALDYGRFCKNVAFVEALSIHEINFLLNEYADTHGLT
jgi:predicted RNA methylase